jgi:hypothetical protein
MKKFIFNCLTVSVLLLASCKKLDLSGDFGGFNWGGLGNIRFSGSSFDTSALNYIQLPFNRYFIYKDPSTGSTDSVVITQSIDSFSLQPIGPGYPLAYFLHTFKLTLTGFSGTPNQTWYKGSASTNFPPGLATTSIHIIDSIFSLSNEQTNLPGFWYPFISSALNQYAFIPSLTFEGRTYTAVHSFSSSNGLQPTDINYQASLFCWVKGVGIIKREIRTFNSVKTSLLVRYG